MLAELAAANAAFKVIKAAVGNGKDIYTCGKSLTDWMTASSSINVKQSSKYSGGSAFEAWEAQEALREQRADLKFMLNKRRLQGWVDFVRFEAEWHRERNERIRLKAKKRLKLKKDIVEVIKITSMGISIIVCIVAAVFGVAWYYK